MLDIGLIQQCSPSVPSITVNSIVKQESGFNPYAIGVKGGLKRQPATYAEAVATAEKLIKDGYNIDMGLGQINSSNLAKLGLSVSQVFQPCTNINALQRVFVGCFNGTKKFTNDGQLQVRMAFSCYNTGNYSSGFQNGYVGKIVRNHDFFRGVLPANIAYKTSAPVTVKNVPVTKMASPSSAPKAKENPATPILATQKHSDEQLLAQTNSDVAVAKLDNSTTEKLAKATQSWDVFGNF